MRTEFEHLEVGDEFRDAEGDGYTKACGNAAEPKAFPGRLFVFDGNDEVETEEMHLSDDESSAPRG